MSNYQPGDILACYGADWGSRGISLATSSILAPAGLHYAPSHVGIVVREESVTSDHLVIESTTLTRRPCVVLGKQVSGLQAHLPFLRVKDYEAAGGSVSTLRLTRANRLTRSESAWLTRTCLDWVRDETPYDILGAALSGTRVYQALRIFPSADSESLFCSEFLAYLLQSICRMNRSNPSRYSPGRLVRELVKTGVYEIIEKPGTGGKVA